MYILVLTISWTISKKYFFEVTYGIYHTLIVRVCVYVCVRACVRACARACLYSKHITLNSPVYR